jgi:hypothetical protein
MKLQREEKHGSCSEQSSRILQVAAKGWTDCGAQVLSLSEALGFSVVCFVATW